MKGPASVIPVDLDGDGVLDLASANNLSNNLALFFQDSQGKFSLQLVQGEMEGSMDFPISLAAADLDGDGDLDLASANQLGDSLSIFLQTSPGRFIPHPRGPLSLGGNESPLNHPQSVAAMDIDGDGDVDLISANTLSENITIFLGGR